jgi:hypothetical protein
VDRIAEIAAIANIPIFCYFLSSPIMDLGFSRRKWILLMNGTMALCLALAAATGFALMLSFGNLPVAYMTWVDGAGYKHGGARGLMSADALASGIGGLLLLVLARYCARRWKSVLVPHVLIAPAVN